MNRTTAIWEPDFYTATPQNGFSTRTAASRAAGARFLAQLELRTQSRPQRLSGASRALPAQEISQARVEIIGIAPLILQACEVRRLEFPYGQRLRGETAGFLHDPTNDKSHSLRFGLPGSRFKHGLIAACAGRALAALRSAAQCGVHILDDLAAVEGAAGVLSLPGGRRKSEPRYLATWTEWRVSLNVRFDARLLQIGLLVELLNAAGRCTGIGEQSPKLGGRHGTYAARAAA